MRILGALQNAIEKLHAVDTFLDVRAYIVGDEVRDCIPGARSGLPEQLFVRDDGDAVEVALYLDPDVLHRLERDHPHRRLHGGNLESYCIALEGISHFVFLVWRARLGRPVSALELEIQAEVDKFVTAWLLLSAQGQSLFAAANMLRRRLFESYGLRSGLSAEETRRYHTANRVARAYCGSLVRRFGRDSESSRIKKDVRTFYRRGLAEKFRAA